MRQAITAPAEQASKAGMAEAVGDVKEAAIQKATSQIVNNLQGKELLFKMA